MTTPFLRSIDLDASQFDPCCSNQDLCIIRCPSCRHLMGFCRECDTSFPDLRNPRSSRSVTLTDSSRDRLPCGGCGQPFPEFYFLTPPNRHRYLVGESELRARGFGHLLAALPKIPGTWRLLAHGLDADAIVDWAVRALERGHDTPQLRLVAGFLKPASLVDVEAPFLLALGQLGFPLPLCETTIRRSYAREIAEAVVTGAISPREGANEMERYVLSPLGHPNDLRPWCFLQSNLHPETYAEVSDAERDRLLLAEARRLLEA